MKAFLFSVLLLLSSPLFAQQPAPQWKASLLTDATLASFLQANPNVLVVCCDYASTKDMVNSNEMIRKALEAVKGRTPAVIVARMSLSNNGPSSQTMSTHHVQRAGSLLFFKQGKLVVQSGTTLPAVAITNMLNSYL